MEERKWRKRREWKKKKQSGEAIWGREGCGECNREDGEVEKARRWNVEVFLSYVFKEGGFPCSVRR